MERYEGIIICYTIICLLLAAMGSQSFNNISTGQSEENKTVTDTLLDFTSIITDVSAFIIIAFVGYIATRVNSWIKGNKEWKEGIQKNFTEQTNKIIQLENEYKQTTQKISNSIEILVADLGLFKQINERELSEISNDYDAISTFTIENRVEIKQLKEDVKDIKSDLKDRNK